VTGLPFSSTSRLSLLRVDAANRCLADEQDRGECPRGRASEGHETSPFEAIHHSAFCRADCGVLEGIMETVRLTAALAGLALMLASLGPQVAASSSSSRVTSPTVVTSYVAEDDQIVLLTLWRGSPGWFLRGNQGGSASAWGSSSSGGARNESIAASFGGLTLNTDIDYQKGVASVHGYDIVLEDTNVVLLDQVDGAAGPQLAATRRFDLSLPKSESGDPVQIAIRRHKELFDYLQCDLELPDAVLPPGPAPLQQYMRSTMIRICDMMRTK